MLYVILNVLLLGALASSEYSGMSLRDRIALRNLLMNSNYYDFPLAPSQRDLENTAINSKVVIPPLTFIQGGTGEGVQHLGAEGDIPNRQNPIPEVSSQYDNPPNPCPPGGDLAGKKPVQSKVHDLICACEEGWDLKERRDCSAAPKCCMPNMPNDSEFVNQYQLTERAIKNQQLFSQTRNKYSTGAKRSDHMAKKTPVYKRSINSYLPGNMVRHVSKKSAYPIRTYVNPYTYNQPHLNSVVAKKAPLYSGAKLNM
ncbi:uncharacterized protein LOC121418453 [Lytechinus variegatus]|uniref:uncharacterized protein LOC121418453 n=1 Tax=Lytechinus variegatus TaxID=7654 RepID=UPI001BB25823|nr:uncharacterized protein LOC121418453 [Lytechinus variegatus]